MIDHTPGLEPPTAAAQLDTYRYSELALELPDHRSDAAQYFVQRMHGGVRVDQGRQPSDGVLVDIFGVDTNAASLAMAELSRNMIALAHGAMLRRAQIHEQYRELARIMGFQGGGSVENALELLAGPFVTGQVQDDPGFDVPGGLAAGHGMSVQEYREECGYSLLLSEVDPSGYPPGAVPLEPALSLTVPEEAWEAGWDAARWLPELLEGRYTDDEQDD